MTVAPPSDEILIELLEAGVHFGHQSRRWNPRMKPFIFEKRNQIHIVDLTRTAERLTAACEFLTSVAKARGKVLFVGCKKQAQEAVKEAATAAGQFYINQRWLGGTLTNNSTIKRSIARMKVLETIETSAEGKRMTKKEHVMAKRELIKLQHNLLGIRDMDRLPDAVIIVDTAREMNAVLETKKLNIPTVGIVDTNADPSLITYPVPGNDDAIRAIRVILQKFVDALVEGAGETGGKAERESLMGVSA